MTGRRFRVDRLLLPALLACAALVPCLADAERPIRLDRYQVTTYEPEHGAPADPDYVSQTPDGFLWLLSSTSLDRFDGVRFERWKDRDGRAATIEGTTAFATDRRGGVWLGYARGSVAVIRDGRMTTYGSASGLPDANYLHKIHEAGSRMLVGTRGGLYAQHGERWELFEPLPELRGKPIDDFDVDSAGRLWIKTPEAIHAEQPDGSFRTFALPTGPDAAIAGLLPAPDGSMWYWNHNGDRNACRIFPDPTPACWRAANFQRPIFDRDGVLWWGMPDRIQRVVDVATLDVRDPDALMRRVETLHVKGNGIFEAADGSLWVHGSRGVTRLRRPLIEKADTPSGGIVAGDDGDVWLASYTRGLMRVGRAEKASPPFYKGEDASLWTATAKDGDPRAVFTRLTDTPAANTSVVLERYLQATRTASRVDRDPNGGFFVSRVAPPALTHVVDGVEKPIPVPTIDRNGIIRGAKRDRHGNLWLGVGRQTPAIYRRDGDAWIPNGGRSIPAGVQLNGFIVDADDTLWIGAGRDGVVAVDAASKVRRYGAAEGLDIGIAGDLYVAADRVWAVGMRGVAFSDGDGFVTLAGNDGEPFRGVTGLVVRPDGELWLNGADGITRIAADEWRRATTTRTRSVRYLRLDHWDGLESLALSGPFPSAAAASDGTLWFAMSAGLYPVRLAELPPLAPPPTVVIGALTVDDTIRDVSGDLAFAPGTYRIAIDFAAPGAQRPERTRYRYRLARNGEWDPWLDIGARQEVAFGRLGHGHYALEIAASGRDGDWSTTPTPLAFRVLPAFHQTWTFYGLLALALALLLAFAYAGRVRRLSARIHAEMGARLRERERIARDLHDTLLQGIQGLLLSFQAIASKLAPDDPLRARMERSLDRTQDVLREGRDRVSTLRDPQASTLDLADSLQRHARDFAVEKKLLCEVAVPHAPRPLQPVAYEELLQVGREAISNAFRHSQGTQVRVTLAYADEGVLLVVVDDGVGLPDDASRAEGRWGLKGMHERAHVAGALLSLKRRPEGGTEVKMFLPAARAYSAGAARPTSAAT